MTKKELRTGDIIVNREGYLGVVLKDEEYILYQEIGMDYLDEFDDELVYNDNDYRDGDIMEVYRGCSFLDYEDGNLIWQRDKEWVCPTAEERKERCEKQEQELRIMVEKMREEEKRNESIFVISQFFYGNRTGTEVKKENIDYFLRGHLDGLYPEWIKDVNRKAVKVPGSENIVIVYDQTQEDRYVNVKFPEIYAREEKRYLEDWGEELKMHVSCEIPEIGFKIHTRCFACRVDENGALQSLEDGDGEKFIKYFPKNKTSAKNYPLTDKTI